MHVAKQTAGLTELWAFGGLSGNQFRGAAPPSDSLPSPAHAASSSSLCLRGFSEREHVKLKWCNTVCLHTNYVPVAVYWILWWYICLVYLQASLVNMGTHDRSLCISPLWHQHKRYIPLPVLPILTYGLVTDVEQGTAVNSMCCRNELPERGMWSVNMRQWEQ